MCGESAARCVGAVTGSSFKFELPLFQSGLQPDGSCLRQTRYRNMLPAVLFLRGEVELDRQFLIT